MSVKCICRHSALLVSLCTACTLQQAKIDLPSLPTAFDYGDTTSEMTWPSQSWYREFSSPELDDLISQARAASFDISIARARTLQAQARVRQSRASILPNVDLNGNGNHYTAHSEDGTLHETDWSGLLAVNYELDFWGKNRAAAASAKYLALAARADSDTVALTTLANVASVYFQVLTQRERLANARANATAARGLLDIVNARYQAGFSSPVEMAAQRGVLASAEAVIFELSQSEQETRAALAALIGKSPEGFVVVGMPLDAVTEPQVSPGLPAELLRRRPDIAMAEANLASANADVVVARAAFFPSLTLTAAGGIGNPAVAAAVNTLTGTGPVLNVGAALAQPIFDAGRLRAQRDEAVAKRQELLTSYRAAIVSALIDVENALFAIRQLNDAAPFQRESVLQTERAFAGAQIRYQQGYGDYLSVLEAQRAEFAARNLYSGYRLTRLQAFVSLCKALGGGWEAPLDSSPMRSRGPSSTVDKH